MSITLVKKGISMFDIGANILINATNCQGIMGGGLALEFKQRFPAMYDDYVDMCDRGLRPGVHHTFLIDENTLVLNFPTKDQVGLPSTNRIVAVGLATIIPVLVALRPILVNAGLTKVAVPALGCGLGGLDWQQVAPAIIQALSHPLLADYQFYVFEPQ